MLRVMVYLQAHLYDDVSLEALAQQGETTMKVQVREIPARKVIFIRHQGPYEGCGAAWEKLCTWAAPRGLLQPGVEFVGLSYDDPDVTPEKLKTIVRQPVREDAP